MARTEREVGRPLDRSRRHDHACLLPRVSDHQHVLLAREVKKRPRSSRLLRACEPGSMRSARSMESVETSLESVATPYSLAPTLYRGPPTFNEPMALHCTPNPFTALWPLCYTLTPPARHLPLPPGRARGNVRRKHGVAGA